MLARGIVGTNQQIADNLFVGVPQGRHRHHSEKAAAVLAHVGQLVNVLYAPGGLEYEGFEPGRDRLPQFPAQGLGAGDKFLRIRDVGRRDSVNHIRSGKAQHVLRTHIEDLNDALFIGCNA